MANVPPTQNSQRTRSASRRKAAQRRVAVIAMMGIVLFGAGFFVLWSVGSWIVGGGGFPGGGSATAKVTAPVTVLSAGDYTVSPLVDLQAFRDLSYVPVKGIYMTSYAASD